MDFIKQLVCFHRKATGNLTPNATAIYLYLFMENNDCGWEEWFEVSDYWMCKATGIKRRETIVAALNLLKQRGLIDFQRGTQRNRPSKYKIQPLFNSAKTVLKDSSKDSVEHSAKTVSRDSSKDGFLLSNQNLKVKEKERGRKTRTQFIPPTIDEVNEYVLEKGLHVSAKKFWDYYDAGGWKDAKGNAVKNWKQKILTWEAHEPKKELSTKQYTGNPQNPQSDIDRAIEFFENREEGTA